MVDPIERQDAIDAFERFIHELGIDDEPYNYGEMALSKDNVPSVQLDRKEGKWIKKMLVTETEKYISYDPEWYCSCCETKYDSHIAKIVNFCYVCGADMRGEQNG